MQALRVTCQGTRRDRARSSFFGRDLGSMRTCLLERSPEFGGSFLEACPYPTEYERPTNDVDQGRRLAKDRP